MSGPRPPRSWRQQLRWAWDSLSIYLPILLMGLLGLSSYWVLRSTPEPAPPAPQRPIRHEPDYFMRSFSVRTFDPAGALKTEIFGAEARHYPDTDTLEVDQARVRSIGPAGQLTTATAQRLSTNADQTDYLLEGRAEVVREGGRNPRGEALPKTEFHSDHLRILTETRRIESDRPVVLIRGRDRITANSLRYDDQKRIADLSGRVHATLAAR